jgi:hypothetical protein
VILQDDNARPHTANITKAAIQELDWDWRFFHIRPTLLTFPIGLPPLQLSLSNNLRGVSFNDAELQN